MGRFSLSRRFPFLWDRRSSAREESRPLIQKHGNLQKDTFSAPPYIDTDDSSEGKTESSSFSHGERSREPSWMFSSWPTSHLQPCGSTNYLLKYILVTPNLLVGALGLSILGLGLWGLVEKQSLTQERLAGLGTDPMLLLTTFGLALALLCTAGCAGALRENSCLLRAFGTALLAVFTAQVLIGILAYSLQDQIVGVLRAAMLGAIAHYQDDVDLRFITDEMQLLQLFGSRGAGVRCAPVLLCGPAGERQRVELAVRGGRSPPGRALRPQGGVPGGLPGIPLPLGGVPLRSHRHGGRCPAGPPDSHAVLYGTPARQDPLEQDLARPQDAQTLTLLPPANLTVK
ncbi:uncharacterized protein tspan10 isoform X2 [Brachyhypopomus gauderio]|uniref:uncharacterized protein tspan10 isoform X2 n=1 Tax=Brachyhypopomus gauderio TaxID=698409 RepID=UPI0040432B76